MSGKKEQKPNSLKKSDRMIDAHREFLDMDTDEEDLGRQESPEAEEELPPEPPKPVYNEEDLTALVSYVKDLTILSPFENANWSEKCEEAIQEYFTNPSHVLLTIFYEENKLCTSLGLPEHAPRGFTYFLRSPWHIYTPENFFTTVLFGSVSENTKNFLLKFMENIYAPIALYSDDYASFIKSDVISNLHDFIIQLMEEVYKPLNLTALYVPRERFLKTFLGPSNNSFLLRKNKDTVPPEEDEAKQKLIHRLEKIVWCWIRQIHEAVKFPSTRRKIKSIQDELDYWNTKHTNLKYLRTQVFNTEVQSIIQVLRNLHTPGVNKFEQLTALIEIRLEEASSNLMYLNVLFDFCKDLNLPEDAEDSLTEALLLIIFIWTESPFYNTTNNIGTLCQALSAQIMCKCKKYIKLDVAFEKNPADGIKMLEKCILCCDIYKTIYDNLTHDVIARINPHNKWDVRKEDVFDNTDTFKQRCLDVIEICEAIIVFKRCNKVGVFGGPKGTKYEAYCRQIENLFGESLNEIIISANLIFSVTNPNWHDKIRQFKHTILHLENMVTNLINDTFKEVKNIEEGIEMIYALQIFKRREVLENLLLEKWIQVWQIFSSEIEFCYMNVIYESEEYEKSRKNSNADVNILCIYNYLEYQYTVMSNAMVWIGESSVEKCILQRYKHVLNVIDERRKMFNIYSTHGTQ